MGLAYVLTVLSLFACCTKIIVIHYSQAMNENLVIYSSPSYFTEVAGARECNPGPFLQPGISGLSYLNRGIPGLIPGLEQISLHIDITVLCIQQICY